MKSRRTPPLFLAAALLAPSALAQFILDAEVTPLAGAFRYDLTFRNQTAEDVAIVSILDAPLADPLIGPSLTTPPGFLASYDDGLGFIDFLEDTLLFGAGEVVGGFSFDSLAGPDASFSAFSALSVLGNEFTGSIQIRPGNVVIPEASTALAAAGVAGCLLIHAVRRFRHRA